ncbi:MAG: hypothetical protein DMF14_01015 [Verrucomicrobia bacterium]|nr:MAG: hypothetical protein DMF14_01015 [Verrucomicrobiota bacterium]
MGSSSPLLDATAGSEAAIIRHRPRSGRSTSVITLDRPTRFVAEYKAKSGSVHALSTRFLGPTAKTPAESSNPIPAPARETLIVIPRRRATSPRDENAQ